MRWKVRTDTWDCPDLHMHAVVHWCPHLHTHQQAHRITLKTNNPHRLSTLVMDTQWTAELEFTLGYSYSQGPRRRWEPRSFKNSRILPFWLQLSRTSQARPRTIIRKSKSVQVCSLVIHSYHFLKIKEVSKLTVSQCLWYKRCGVGVGRLGQNWESPPHGSQAWLRLQAFISWPSNGVYQLVLHYCKNMTLQQTIALHPVTPHSPALRSL